LLAFQSPERRHETLAIWGGTGKAERLSEIETTLADIHAKGYRIGASLQLVGVEDISVPVLGPSGDALAVLTCPYMQRVDAETADADTALRHLREVAARLSIA
jgi:DNA-binding IclR family transcriptional regulator